MNYLRRPSRYDLRKHPKAQQRTSAARVCDDRLTHRANPNSRALKTAPRLSIGLPSDRRQVIVKAWWQEGPAKYS